jgi:hypothetical protein
LHDASADDLVVKRRVENISPKESKESKASIAVVDRCINASYAGRISS